MAANKIKYKNQSLKKYFVGLFIILAIIFLALYFRKWDDVREQEKYLQSYLVSTDTISLEMNNIDEIRAVLSETPNYYFVYISYTNDKDVYNLEKKLKPLIDEYYLDSSFYFLNVTDIKENNTNYKKEIAEALEIKENVIDDIPVILYFQDGELASEGIHTALEFEKLLEDKDIKSQ